MVKSAFGEEFDQPTDRSPRQCLCLFDRMDQKPTRKIPLSDDELRSVGGLCNTAYPGALSEPAAIALAVRLALENPAFKNVVRGVAGESAAPSAQAQKPHTHYAPYIPPGGAVISVFASSEDRFLADFGITDQQYAAIQQSAKNAGMRVDAFFELRLRGFIGELLDQNGAHRKSGLEKSIQNAVALIGLFLNRAISEADDEIYPSLPGYDIAKSTEISGLQTLASSVQGELLAALYPQETATEVAS